MRKKILISNHNTDLQFILQIFLEEEGYEVIISPVEDTLRMAQEHKPAVVLLDEGLLLSVTTRWCKELKTNSQTSHILVVLLSTSQHFLEAAAKECRADDFLLVPFDLEDVITVIKKHVL